MPVKSSVADILDRRNESRRWYQLNYWDEYEEAMRARRCKVQPITKKDRKGNEVEDLTRTNVGMPELSLIIRRKVARLTAQPPQINYTGVEPEIAEKLTALTYMQWDRSGEGKEHKRVIDSAVTFGRGISKLFYDTIEVNRTLRRDVTQMRSRRDLMQFQGNSADEIDSAVQTYGDVIPENDMANMIAEQGPELRGQVKVKKYEGPVKKAIFIGDFFDEPGCRNLDESGFAVENYWETDLWLQKMVRKRYIDPETEEELPIFDTKKAEELLEMGSWNPNQGSQQPYDLRTRLRTFAEKQTLPLFPLRLLPGKRFDILECHERDEKGRIWITWVGNEKVLLGRMPYPWDLYGKYAYSELILQTDPINAVGDSMPRLLSSLWKLHNAAVGSRRDLVNQILRPVFTMRSGDDIPDEIIERSLMRIILCKNPDTLKPLLDSPAIGQAITSANEEESQVLRMIALAAPEINTVDVGTESNPMSGKLATTAILNAKSSDALTQAEIDQVNFYLKDEGEKKLWMNQQMAEEEWQIPSKFVKTQGLSQRYGKTAMLTLDPMEIQEDIEVEPVAGSMLAVDDDLNRNSMMQAYTLALQDPANWDTNYLAKQVASTIRNLDQDKAVPPPQPPPPADPKTSVAVSIKFPELPAEAQVNLLQKAGLITEQGAQELELRDTMNALPMIDRAASAAVNLSGPAVSDQEQEPEMASTRGVND